MYNSHPLATITRVCLFHGSCTATSTFVEQKVEAIVGPVSCGDEGRGRAVRSWVRFERILEVPGPDFRVRGGGVAQA